MSRVVETSYGFLWDGIVAVERDVSDPRFGYVLSVYTEHDWLEIRSSPKGQKLTIEQRETPKFMRDRFALARAAGVIDGAHPTGNADSNSDGGIGGDGVAR